METKKLLPNYDKAGKEEGKDVTTFTENSDGSEEVSTVTMKNHTYKSVKSKDGKWTSESKVLVSVADSSKGIKFTVKSLGTGESWKTDMLPGLTEKKTGLRVVIPKDNSIPADKDYELYFPYVDEGKDYDFIFNGTTGKEVVYVEEIKVTAGKGKGNISNDFNIDKWKKLTPVGKIEDVNGYKYAYIGFKNNLKASDLILSQGISNPIIEFGFCVGYSDWKKSIWITGCMHDLDDITLQLADTNAIMCNYKEVDMNEVNKPEYDGKYFLQIKLYYEMDGQTYGFQTDYPEKKL